MNLRSSSGLINLGTTALLITVTLWFAMGLVNFSGPPYEDAAMLMRYAQHFGQGLGIVWNQGERPVDGATDFLFTVLAGLLVKAGLSVEVAVRAIGFTAHILTVVLVYAALHDLYRAHLIAALVSALCLAVGPGLYYVAAYFGTPFFALFACLTWWIALRLILQNRDQERLSILFSLSALVLGLIRPEGVILAVLMLLSVVYFHGARYPRSLLRYFVGVFVLAGGLYFLWRWQYFGYPLPNPFYKKGQGTLHLSGLRDSVVNAKALLLPFLAFFILGLSSRAHRRLAITFLIPVIGFALAFALISPEMNFKGRFQYALLPIVAISWYPFAQNLWSGSRARKVAETRGRRGLAVALLILCSLAAVGYEYNMARGPSSERGSRDGRYEAGLALREYRDKGYTIATSEAGLLPLYSRWRAVDTWGLNDPWIAHNGSVSAEYLDRFKPEVLVFHGYTRSAGAEPVHKGAKAWDEMVGTLIKYAEGNRYVLAAAFGVSPYEAHYYYVRGDCPDRGAIVERLRSVTYYWYGTDRTAQNFASIPAAH